MLLLIPECAGRGGPQRGQEGSIVERVKMLKSRNVAWVVSVGISLVSGWGCSTVLDPNTTDPNQFDPSAFYVNIQVDAELQEGEGYLTGLNR